jgi:hypothetical protein
MLVGAVFRDGISNLALLLVIVLSETVLGIDGKSKHIQPRLANGWLCHLSPFEYE